MQKCTVNYETKDDKLTDLSGAKQTCKAHAIVVDTELVDAIHIWQLEPRTEYSTYNKLLK